MMQRVLLVVVLALAVVGCTDRRTAGQHIAKAYCAAEVNCSGLTDEDDCVEQSAVYIRDGIEEMSGLFEGCVLSSSLVQECVDALNALAESETCEEDAAVFSLCFDDCAPEKLYDCGNHLHMIHYISCPYGGS